MSDENNKQPHVCDGEKKVALVLGGSGAIGQEVAYRLARANYTLAIHGSRQTRVNEVVVKCKQLSNSEVIIVT